MSDAPLTPGSSPACGEGRVSPITYLTNTNACAAYGNRWLANILGANAWGTSLIVADGSTFPDCMQHQVANLVGSTNGSPPILAGAAVEGPNSFAAKGRGRNRNGLATSQLIKIVAGSYQR